MQYEGRRVNEGEIERTNEEREGEETKEKGDLAWKLDLHVDQRYRTCRLHVHVLFTQIYIYRHNA